MSEANMYRMHDCGYPDCAPCHMKGYESAEIDYVTSYLDRVVEAGKFNGVVVDIGAHVGLWSLCMSEWYQNRYNLIPAIYALEPESKNFVQLRRNAQQAMTGIIPVQAAAWNKNTWLNIKLNANPGRHQVTDLVNRTEQSMRVQAVALDNVAKSPEQRQIDFIKVDVEGAELLVMNGARGILSENEQLLVMLEYSVDYFIEYGVMPSQLTGFMRTHGYRPARPIDEKTVKTITTGELKRVMFVKGEIS